jgi:hypothetical protein
MPQIAVEFRTIAHRKAAISRAIAVVIKVWRFPAAINLR